MIANGKCCNCESCLNTEQASHTDRQMLRRILISSIVFNTVHAYCQGPPQWLNGNVSSSRLQFVALPHCQNTTLLKPSICLPTPNHFEPLIGGMWQYYPPLYLLTSNSWLLISWWQVYASWHTPHTSWRISKSPFMAQRWGAWSYAHHLWANQNARIRG